MSTVLRCARAIAAANDAELDQAVRGVLVELAEALDVDRVHVCAVEPQAGSLKVTHEFCRAGFQPPQDMTYTVAELPHAWERLLRQGELVGLRGEHASAEALALLRKLREEGIQSLCLFPLHGEGGPVAFLSLEWLGQPASLDVDLQVPRAIAPLLTDAWRRRADNARREALEAGLRKVQKRQAVSAMATGLAHDFNNTLTVIGGATDMAQQQLSGLKVPERTLDLLMQVGDAVERSRQVTGQLLGLARANVTQRCTVRASRTIETTVRAIERTVPSHVTWQLAVDPDGPQLWIAPSEIEQIVLNLCLNAAQAMPDGGVLSVRYGHEPGDATRAVLVVEDTGVGIPSAQRQRVFDPFFTTKEACGGTGLGLPVVRNIVESYAGAIDIESKPGEGTRVRVCLPAAERAVESRPAEVRINAMGGSETVLLAEDDPFVLELSAHVLGRAGYRVLAFEDGERALAALQDSRTSFDALVLDAMLPTFHGTEIARRARTKRPEVPVVFMTGYAAEGRFEALAGWSRMEVLQKPFVPRTLLQALRRVLS